MKNTQRKRNVVLNLTQEEVFNYSGRIRCVYIRARCALPDGENSRKAFFSPSGNRPFRWSVHRITPVSCGDARFVLLYRIKLFDLSCTVGGQERKKSKNRRRKNTRHKSKREMEERRSGVSTTPTSVIIEIMEDRRLRSNSAFFFAPKRQGDILKLIFRPFMLRN